VIWARFPGSKQRKTGKPSVVGSGLYLVDKIINTGSTFAQYTVRIQRQSRLSLSMDDRVAF
jgi:hypothetical protein